MWKSTGELKLSLEEGIETVVKDGWSYIVHPAFIDDSANGFNNGGWDSDLAGIWVGKYESSRSDATASSVGTSDTIKVIPNVKNWQGIFIGDCYTNAYNYERTKESHLIKNSEWGAVAYLTHSKYGRNGHEIAINSSSSSITGYGGGNYAYNTEQGQKASSTGNIYGIYDLSGGAYEYVGAFNSTGSRLSSNGGSFAGTDKESTKYATKYSNTTSTGTGTKIYEIGKTGDATREVFANKNNTNWFGNGATFIYSNNPFFIRGGYYGDSTYAGIFFSYYHHGSASSSEAYASKLSSFRIVCK